MGVTSPSRDGCSSTTPATSATEGMPREGGCSCTGGVVASGETHTAQLSGLLGSSTQAASGVASLHLALPRCAVCL